ncbi:hypothetical protein RugamoR64_61890 [Duganella rhizosphaerae]|uniref:hypothetical protein n=1 Tax=Duganella rhizosphaerae TaxID=2885763 RepID=UPI0030E9C347
MSKSSFAKRQLAPDENSFSFVSKVAGVVCLIAILYGLYAIGAARKEEARQWAADVENINKYQDVVVPRKFTVWSELIVQKDGSIERWSGKDSEIIFVDYQPSCEHFIDRIQDVPCWTVYARTKNTARYFTVDVKVNRENDWRIEVQPKHNDATLQSVVRKAMELGRDEVVKRLAVPKNDA